MRNFTYHNPTRIIFGKDTVDKIGNELNSDGISKVLLLYGQNSIVRTGLFDQVSTLLQQAGIEIVPMGGVKPNPVLEKVQEGIKLSREEKVQAILAVGGGSVFDSAKAIAAGVKYDGDVWDFFAGASRVQEALPIYGILTISATGSEMNGNAVITKSDENKKWGTGSPYLYPRLSIIDPSLQESIPREQVANGAVDILSHIFELYFDGTENVELMQEYSEALIRTLMRTSKILIDDPGNYNARAEFAWTATLALNGTNRAGRTFGDWASHDIEHSLSAFYNVAHGAGLAVITPAWMEYVYRENIDVFARFAEKIFNIAGGTKEEIARAGIENLQIFFKQIGAPLTLQELGVAYDDLEKMAENAVLKGSLGRLKKLAREDVLKIYQIAYK